MKTLNEHLNYILEDIGWREPDIDWGEPHRTPEEQKEYEKWLRNEKKEQKITVIRNLAHDIVKKASTSYLPLLINAICEENPGMDKKLGPKRQQIIDMAKEIKKHFNW